MTTRWVIGLASGSGVGAAGAAAGAAAGCSGASGAAAGAPLVGEGAVAAGVSVFASAPSEAAVFFAAAFLAGAFLAAPFSASARSASPYSFLKRISTGGSTVDDADLTNSPISLSLARTTLLSTPSSLASSWTRTLATLLLLVRAPVDAVPDR